MIASGVLLGSVALLGTAARLTPPAAGLGAHTQLGLSPCSFPMLFGIPCPTCGMTTSFAHFVRGNLITSFHTQPAGMLLAFSTLLLGMASIAVLLTGRMIELNWYRIPPGRVAILLVAILLFGWGYKMTVGV
jgi:Protein of unknown function (DUF2752)